MSVRAESPKEIQNPGQKQVSANVDFSVVENSAIFLVAAMVFICLVVMLPIAKLVI